MKYYIFFSFSGGIGGGQNYVNSKISYLVKKGWTPLVFTAYSIKRKIPWDNLRKYTCYQAPELVYTPEMFSLKRINKILNKMESFIKNPSQVIIESSTDYWGEWGELFAKRLNAKHFCFLLDERLELYKAKEFLYYKYLRNEVAGIHISSMKRLFAGYRNVDEDSRFVLTAANYGSVSDIKNHKIDKIKICDYNISYFGRNKQYCQNIWKGVIQFAKNNPLKKINFIILGEITKEKGLPKNLKVTFLGFINPVPKAFFSKVDVIIAGAGCAWIAAKEGVPVIVADADSCLANGLLGYTTKSTLFEEKEGRPFEDLLHDVLINNITDTLIFDLPSKTTVEEFYEKHFEFINKSSQEKEYFDVLENPQYVYSKYFRIKFVISKYFPLLARILKPMGKKNG